MQDDPDPSAILAAVAAFLRDDIAAGLGDGLTPDTAPRLAFQARVAASALALVQRQLAMAPASDAAEQSRLCALLGQDGPLAVLNAGLARRIADGSLDPRRADVAAHLRATTLEKLAVDQPTYSGYRAALAGEP